MNRRALVVGINRYPFIKNLERPASDAEAIAHLLENHGGFQVRRLPAGIGDDRFNVNPKPGNGEENVNITILEEEIIKLFAIGETDCPDLALLFFAGHGLRKPRGLKEGFLATSEACPRKEVYGFALNSLRDILEASEVKQQVIWLDCCHSGKFIDVLDKADPRNAGKVRDRCFIAACSASETAYGTGEHGLLTSILLQGLDPQGCEVNEWINNLSLAAFVNDNEDWRNFDQRPVFNNSGGEIQLIKGGKSQQNLVENSLVNQPGCSNINIGTRKILHVSLSEQDEDYASVRYFWENSADGKEHKLSLAEIKDLGNQAEADLTRSPVDYATTGQLLYNWLDQSDRFLTNALNQSDRKELIIAIATDQKLAKLPWELLHDGNCFLVEKRPAIIPVRWVSNGQPIAIANSPQNRPLNLLFMATSPLGVEPELDYEAEEGQILEATQRASVDLIVEESGCLDELSYVVREYEKGYFDIFHLTGHTTTEEKKPCFLTEDEYGNRVNSSTADIYDALTSSLPPLIFLSGCRTGYSSKDTVPSMAEELLRIGGTAVLGWGERVRDTDATAAASIFYRLLSQGEAITDALSSTYQTLIKQQSRDWHQLRLYVSNIIPQALVTPLRTKGRKQLPKPTTTSQFRDDEQKLRVASRKDFVGRRRQLQNCLRTLKGDQEKVGVLIHGMGGLGKSSIASRLWDRLSEHEKVLWWRQIDNSNLIKKLSSKLIKPELRDIRNDLNASDDSLDIKLANLFNQLVGQREKPFLLILDDFEWNLEDNQGRFILNPEVKTVLSALVWAIQETGTKHRILITCRYEFDSELLEFFFSQGLESFRKSELTKKLTRLEHFSSERLSEDIRDRALSLADGNPRLLEYLNDEVLGEPDAAAKLTELEQSPELWKNKIIWSDLYKLIDEPLQRVLSHCLIYEIPVPMGALEVVCAALPNYQQQLHRGQELGLIEISPDVQAENQVFRVSRILPHIIPNIRLPEAPEVYSLYKKAYEILHQLWGNQQNRSQEKWQEIFRLLFADRENPERFRQGFYEMLAVQGNYQADENANIALESELIQRKDELSTENLCSQLENYLSQQEWRKADEETAWIFYQMMVQHDDEGRMVVCKNIPSETLNQIDQLWVNNSQGRFGFSIQKRIWESVGGHPHADFEKIFEKFGDKVGWRKDGFWLSELTFNNNTTTPFSHLPATSLFLVYAWDGVLLGMWWFLSYLFSRKDL